jgi:hypothetical protein
MTIEFCYLIFITADYYAITSFIVPQFLLKKRYVFFCISYNNSYRLFRMAESFGGITNESAFFQSRTNN